VIEEILGLIAEVLGNGGAGCLGHGRTVVLCERNGRKTPGSGGMQILLQDRNQERFRPRLRDKMGPEPVENIGNTWKRFQIRLEVWTYEGPEALGVLRSAMGVRNFFGADELY
jgi:hypothetical protein